VPEAFRNQLIGRQSERAVARAVGDQGAELHQEGVPGMELVRPQGQRLDLVAGAEVSQVFGKGETQGLGGGAADGEERVREG
jgi:hypothetical protein